MSRSDREQRDAERAARRARRLAERAEQRAQRKSEHARRASERAEKLAERAQRRPSRDMERSFEDMVDDFADKWEKKAKAWFDDQADDLSGDAGNYDYMSADMGDDEDLDPGYYSADEEAKRARADAERARKAAEEAESRARPRASSREQRRNTRKARRSSRRRHRQERGSLRSRLNSGRGFYRDKENAKVCGVCAGAADYLEVDTWQVRLVAVLGLLFVPSVAVPVYFITYFLMDDKPYYRRVTDRYDDPEEESVPEPEYSQDRKMRDKKPPKMDNVEAFRTAKEKFSDIEARLRSMETHVTSSRFELQRELRKISGDDA